MQNKLHDVDELNLFNVDELGMFVIEFLLTSELFLGPTYPSIP